MTGGAALLPEQGARADRAAAGGAVSWQLACLVVLGARRSPPASRWYERDKPPARVLALVATLAALAVVGRLAFAAIPNVKPTTDIVLFAGYALGAVPGLRGRRDRRARVEHLPSQGPWTPWQMVGWGGVGVGGARARPLSCAAASPGGCCWRSSAALAGLAFGAWMDVYQLTLAAHQDLDTYLALSATLAALQPRARDRQRGVLPPDRTGLHPRAAPLPAPLRGALAGAGGRRRHARRSRSLLRPAAAAGAPRRRDRAERWLRARAEPRRRLRRGAAARRRASSTAAGPALGLAAAGRNPRDVHRRGGRSLAAYVARDGRSVRDIGEVERTILVLQRRRAVAARLRRPRPGRERSSARRRRDGSIAGYVSYTAFGVLALRSAGVSPGKADRGVAGRARRTTTAASGWRRPRRATAT